MNFKRFIYMRNLYTVIISLLLLFSGQTSANDEFTAPVRIYNLDDWISYKNCNYPTSLSEGYEYIYYGTSGGVIPYHKYGRYWDEPYTSSDGMADDFVTAVLFDPSTNYIWAAHSSGVSYLNPSAEKWENISNDQIHIPDTESIIRLGMDNSYIWLQISNGDIISISKTMGFYSGSSNGQSDLIEWAPSRIDPLPSLHKFAINQPYRFEADGLIYDDDFREYSVSVLFSDFNLDLYGGVWGLGLFEGDMNVKNMTVYSKGPIRNSINALTIFEDRLWTGNGSKNVQDLFNRSGISVYDLDNESWEYFETELIPELASEIVNDIAYNDERLWVGTDQGLSIYNYHKNYWKRYSMTKGLQDEIVWTIALEDTLAWIGTPLGLNKIKLPSFAIKRVYLTRYRQKMKIYKVLCSKDIIWIGTDNGLYSIDKLTHNVEHYDMFGEKIDIDEAVASNVNSIASNDSVTIFSRYGGLLMYHHAKKSFTSIPQVIPATVSYIFDMTVDKKYLWVGTDNGAFLVRIDDFYTEHYTMSDGLAGNYVYKVLIDGEQVWFGTDNGLTKYQWRRYAN